MSTTTSNMGLTKPSLTDLVEDTIPALSNNFQTIDDKFGILSGNFQSIASNESASLGAELTDATGWTSTGWTGSYGTGFTCPVGNTNPLTRTMSATGTNIYQITFTVSSPTSSSDFTVTLGNSNPFVTYQGAGTSYTYTYGIRSVSNGNLVFTPGSTFDGTITGISVKQITGTANPTSIIKDSTGSNVLEIRPTKNSLANVFIGLGTGEYNTTGHENVAIGVNAMVNNTSGFWNIAVGKDALTQNTVGSRNVALGFLALNSNITGHRNVAIGSYALTRNTDGINNIALGADSLWFNTTGNYNVAIGLATLSSNTTGSDNIGMGRSAVSALTSGTGNIGLGYNTLPSLTSGNDNIAIGLSALTYLTSNNGNIAVGNGSLYHATGQNNVGIGLSTMRSISAGDNNIMIGNQAGYGTASATVTGNVVIGSSAGFNINTGADYNVMIGASAGHDLTTGNYNILIGPSTAAPSPTSNQTLNIGNTIYGDLSTSNVAIGAVPDVSTNVLFTGMKLQVGRATKGGGLDLRYSTTTDGTTIGGITFVNMNNTNAGASTRTDVAGITSYASVTNSNVGGDSGGGMVFYTKALSGGLTEKMRITPTGKISIGGNTNPTAILHLPAGSGSANTAPIKLTAGTLNTTPEAGAIEFDGTNLYFVTSAGVRKTITAA